MASSALILYNSNMAADFAILNCNLYGETGDLPDVVHCETIETRAPLHDWVLPPHRHARLHQLLLLDRGGAEATIDGTTWRLGPATLVNVPAGLVHSYAFEPGASGVVATLALEIMDETLRPPEGLRPVLNRPAVWPATERVSKTLHDIAQCFAERAFARAQILRSLAGLLLGQVARELHRHGAEAAATPDLLMRFETLIEAHFAEHWRVGDYARALGASPAHLSRVTKAATGLPASRLIEERLVREARRALAYTDLPISAIAYRLGFGDPAYFSRSFARAIGLSPSAFRSQANGEIARRTSTASTI